MSKAIYSFSGDPITYGHIDIIKRAANVFDQLVVAIGVNAKKKYLFNLKERLQLTKDALFGLSNVEVVSFSGLLVDFAYEINADAIVKGVRNPADFEYENSLFKMGQSQEINIDTFILIAKSELEHVSSTNVKQIQQEQGLIHDYVPLNVKQALEAKMSQQFILSISGEIGSGKTYISNKFVKLANKRKIPIHHIDLDHIAHQIYQDLPQPRYKHIREVIAQTFGPQVKNKNGSINRKVLGEIVFEDHKKLQLLNSIMQQPLLVRIRRELYGKKGLILLNAALIVEAGMTHLSNNNVYVVKTDKKSQKKRLLKRDLSEDQIQRRLESQYTFSQKKAFLQKVIQRDNFGQMWIVDNSKSTNSSSYEKEFSKIISYFNLD
jgi:pantetheine-phosphate adenylyltransferase